MNASIQVKNKEVAQKLLKEKYKLDYKKNGDYYFVMTPEIVDYIQQFKRR